MISQIYEVKTILDVAMAYRGGLIKESKIHHPIIKHYKDYPLFLAKYGLECCSEYYYRFDKNHSDSIVFQNAISDLLGLEDDTFIPYYVEGSKKDDSCIRTTENVSTLYQNKLCEKWDSAFKRDIQTHPKWTKRGSPFFYRQHAKTLRKSLNSINAKQTKIDTSTSVCYNSIKNIRGMKNEKPKTNC